MTNSTFSHGQLMALRMSTDGSDSNSEEAAHIAKIDRWNNARIAGGRAANGTANPHAVGSDEHDGFAEGQSDRMVVVSYAPGAHLGGARNCDDAGTGEGRFHGRM